MSYLDRAANPPPSMRCDPREGTEAVRLSASGNASVLESLCQKATSLYGIRALDNIDLSRLDGLPAKAAVLARALMERGDARAFALAQDMLSHVKTPRWP